MEEMTNAEESIDKESITPQMLLEAKNTSKETLRELIAAIVFLGAVGQTLYLLISVSQIAQGAFFEKNFLVSRCWWIGICVAVFWAWHLEYSLWRALDLNEGGAVSMMRGHAILRYLVAVGFMVALYFMVSKEYRPLATIYVAGVFMLKPGAYLQPLMHKIFNRFGL